MVEKTLKFFDRKQTTVGEKLCFSLEQFQTTVGEKTISRTDHSGENPSVFSCTQQLYSNLHQLNNSMLSIEHVQHDADRST